MEVSCQLHAPSVLPSTNPPRNPLSLVEPHSWLSLRDEDNVVAEYVSLADKDSKPAWSPSYKIPVVNRHSKSPGLHFGPFTWEGDFPRVTHCLNTKRMAYWSRAISSLSKQLHSWPHFYVSYPRCVWWSQWPHSLRRGPAVARLPGFWIRIPPEHGRLSLVNFVCRQTEFSALDWSLVQRSPTECGVPACQREASIMRRPWSIVPW